MADKKQIQLEYRMNTMPKVLYYRLVNPGGLAEWFADEVEQSGNIFTFQWDDNFQKAELLQKKENVFVRFRWMDDLTRKTFFEFRIAVLDLTGEVALLITDFVEDDEKVSTIEQWNYSMSRLRHTLGL
ncbi:MAG: START-like domain-containing protein [Bacteroidia bacterium]|nr:START-like domain-containing protein [Bacteroidia bacterium]